MRIIITNPSDSKKLKKVLESDEALLIGVSSVQILSGDDICKLRIEYPNDDVQLLDAADTIVSLEAPQAVRRGSFLNEQPLGFENLLREASDGRMIEVWIPETGETYWQK